jgi:hypothetical protein
MVIGQKVKTNSIIEALTENKLLAKAVRNVNSLTLISSYMRFLIPQAR